MLIGERGRGDGTPLCKYIHILDNLATLDGLTN